jgi:hypothetical protein
VTKTCAATLNDEQKKVAQNLVVGETTVDQHNRDILGFACVGVVSRIDVIGVLRPDEACRKALMGFVIPPAVWIPALAVGAAGGAVIVVHKNEKKETSCVFP